MDQRQLQIVLKLQDEASKELRKLSGEINTAEKSTSRWGGALEYVAGAAKYAVAALGAAAVAGATWGVKVAAQLETAEVGLKTLLGSSEEAAKTIERLKKEAARTPFELPGLTQATQLLSSVTKDGNKSIDILMDVGEALAAMGKGQPELDRIIVNLQQVAAVGKASMIDIKQFAFAGIPIFDMLEQYFGSHATKGIVDNSEAIAKNAKELAKLKDQLTVANQRQAEFNDKTKASTRIASEMRIADITKQISLLSGTMGDLTRTNGMASTSYTSVEDAIENGLVTFDLLTEMFDKANDSGGQFFEAYKNQAGTFNQAMSNMKDSIGIFLADLVKETGIFGGLTEAMMIASQWLGNYKENVANVTETVKQLLQTLDENTGLVTYFREIWDSISQTFMENLLPALKALWDALQPLMPFLSALAVVIGYTLGGAVLLLINSLTILLTWLVNISTFITNVFSGALNGLIDIISDVIVWVDKMIDRFKSAWEWAGKVASSAGSFVSGATTSVLNAVLPGRASGGPVTAGMPYIVGEAGPELFVPRASGSIIPNGAGGGGVVVNVYGDVTGREIVEKVQSAIMMSLSQNMRFAV